MPKQTKTKDSTKSRSKSKNRKIQPETPGITTRKSYWVMLTLFMVIVFSIASFILGLGVVNTVVLMLTITFLLSLIGFVSTTSSNLSKSKRATFLFAGASIIGFGVWAIIAIVSTATGLIENLFADTFYLIPSIVICLTAGAFIGELLGKNKRIQTFVFKPEDIPP
ncbi:MAG: hypothetical protein FWH37_01640 [Candidatus Bathyarchaeota archaeon]|nr:hypothetical protein [Candidatus Termiticorpusculum sp.]